MPLSAQVLRRLSFEEGNWMEQKERNRVFTPYFVISALFTALFAIASIVSPTMLATIMTNVQLVFAVEYGWFAMLIPFLCVLLLVVLGL